MKKRAFGVIDLLIGLVVMSAIFLLMTNSFRAMSSFNQKSDTKSIQEEIDAQVNEIEQMRIKSIEIQDDLIKKEAH